MTHRLQNASGFISRRYNNQDASTAAETYQDYLLQSAYYQKSFRFSHYVNGTTNLDEWSNLDRIDFEQSLLIPENEARIQKIRQRNKLKSETCQNEFYIDQLFKHCEYYEAKDEYLKQLIAQIDNDIDAELACQSPDILQQTKQILLRIDVKKLKQHMLAIDITLKLRV